MKAARGRINTKRYLLVSGGAFRGCLQRVGPSGVRRSSHQNPHQSAQFYSRRPRLSRRRASIASRPEDGTTASSLATLNEYGMNDPELEALMAMDTDGGANGHSMEYGCPAEFAQQQHAKNVAAGSRQSPATQTAHVRRGNVHELQRIDGRVESDDEGATNGNRRRPHGDGGGAAALLGGRTSAPPSPACPRTSRRRRTRGDVHRPGSFEDGVRTMQELEERVAELQQSSIASASAADEAQGQLARLNAT